MNRLYYFLLTISTLLIGYFSRLNTEGVRNLDYFGKVSTFIHDYAGDAIWAGMIYFGFRFLFLESPLKTSFLYTLLFTYAIEISQLYQADWLNAIRHTKLGSLVLGVGFLWSDLVMYFVGISVAFFLDMGLSKLMEKRKH